MATFVKFTFNGLEGVGKVESAADENGMVVVELPSGQSFQMNQAETTEITEDEFKVSVGNLIDRVLSFVNCNMTYDKLYSVMDDINALRAEKDTAIKEKEDLKTQYAELFKRVLSQDRFEEISEVNPDALSILDSDVSKAKVQLGEMSTDKYETFKAFATSFTKLTDRTQTNLPKTTDDVHTNKPKATDYTAAEEVVEAAKLDNTDSGEDISAAAVADTNEVDTTWLSAMAKIVGKNCKEKTK